MARYYDDYHKQMAIPTSRSTQFFCWVYENDEMFWFLEKDLAALLRYHPQLISCIPETWCKTAAFGYDNEWIEHDPDELIVNEWAFYFLIHQCDNGIPLQKWLNNRSTTMVPGEQVFIHEELKVFVEFAKHLKIEWMTSALGPRHVFLLLKETTKKYAYQVLRCQKRNLWNAIKWLNPNEYEPIMYRENFIYAPLMLNMFKEFMVHKRIQYGAKCNRIECNDNRIEMFGENFIDQLIVPLSLSSLISSLPESYPEEWYRLCSRSTSRQHGYKFRK